MNFLIYLKVHKGTQKLNFLIIFFKKPNPYGLKSLQHEIFENVFDSVEIFDF